jgi:hypothetical protein
MLELVVEVVEVICGMEVMEEIHPVMFLILEHLQEEMEEEEGEV